MSYDDDFAPLERMPPRVRDPGPSPWANGGEDAREYWKLGTSAARESDPIGYANPRPRPRNPPSSS